MSQAISTKREHRLDARVAIKCPVFIHGITENGERIKKIHTITDNISQSGLFLQMPQALKPGSVVFVFAQLLSGARLAARGKVVRVEEKEHDLFGLAVCLTQLRLIPPPPRSTNKY